MKCRNCGAHYRTLQLACPYCGTENLIGRIWQKQRSDAELEYEKVDSEVRRVINPYVLNRVLNRILLLGTVLIFSVMFLMVMYFTIRGIIVENPSPAKRAEIISHIEKLYEDENYCEMYAYMQDNEVWDGEDTFKYWQAGLLNFYYDQYKTDKLTFANLPDEKKKEDHFYLDYSIQHGSEVLSKDLGLYKDLTEENQKIYERFKEDIECYLTGYLGLDGEDVLFLSQEEYIYTSDFDEIVRKVRTRNGW